ncbi:MAG: diguanylate cyclase [Pseudomonadota bacterium]
MEIGLSATEGTVLHGLLAEAAGDIVIKLDEYGFIEHASPNIAAVGIDLSQMLFHPHVADLACSTHVDALRGYVAAALAEECRPGPFEFPVAKQDEDRSHLDRKWHALSLRPVLNDDGSAGGALGLLRSVDQRRVLENELHASTTTDVLTGLGNGKLFSAKLRRALKAPEQSVLAMFEIDRFRAILMQYGQSAADEVLWAFAQFLQAMSQPGQELAHLHGGRFGVILSDMNAEAARIWCDDVLETFAALAVGATSSEPRLSASVGLTALDTNVDDAYKHAELALVMARASGGMRVGISGDTRGPVVYRERAMVSELGVSFSAR